MTFAPSSKRWLHIGLGCSMSFALKQASASGSVGRGTTLVVAHADKPPRDQSLVISRRFVGHSKDQASGRWISTFTAGATTRPANWSKRYAMTNWWPQSPSKAQDGRALHPENLSASVGNRSSESPQKSHDTLSWCRKFCSSSLEREGDRRNPLCCIVRRNFHQFGYFTLY